MNAFTLLELRDQVIKLFREDSIYRQELVLIRYSVVARRGLGGICVVLGETVCDEDCHTFFVWTGVPEGVPYMFRTAPELTEEIVQEALQDGFINIVLSRDLELPETKPVLKLVRD